MHLILHFSHFTLSIIQNNLKISETAYIPQNKYKIYLSQTNPYTLYMTSTSITIAIASKHLAVWSLVTRI